MQPSDWNPHASPGLCTPLLPPAAPAHPPPDAPAVAEATSPAPQLEAPAVAGPASTTPQQDTSAVAEPAPPAPRGAGIGGEPTEDSPGGDGEPIPDYLQPFDAHAEMQVEQPAGEDAETPAGLWIGSLCPVPPAPRGDASAVAEPTSPALQLEAPAVAGPASTTPQLDASAVAEPPLPPPLPPPACPPPAPELALPECPSSAPLRPRHAAAHLPCEQLAAVAAANPPEPLGGRGEVASTQLAESRVLAKLLGLARDIRRPRVYVGYSFFLCFCLCRQRRAYFWEGEQRIDILEVYAPWALERCTAVCAVDGVCCCLAPADEGGEAAMMPVSETHPLDMCRHFLAAVRMAGGACSRGPGLQGFYNNIGVAVLGTVMDGDCGIDVACQMLGLPQTIEQRAAVREEVSDYLLARVQKPWMQELMGALQEVDADDVSQIVREVADVPIAVASGEAPPDTLRHSAVAAEPTTAVAVPAEIELIMEAMKWATGATEHAFLTNLIANLPPPVLEEQVRLYQARDCGPLVPHQPKAFVVYPRLLKSRQEAAKAFNMELQRAGWAQGSRLPRHAATTFVAKMVWSKSSYPTLADKARQLRRWHVEFLQMGPNERGRSGGAIALRSGAARPYVDNRVRQRKLGLQGAQSLRGAWVRDALYQWFVAMRYSVDWATCKTKIRSSGQKKCMTRFTRGILRQKVMQLMHDYLRQCLLTGIRAVAFNPTARWFSVWERDYGLSMRKPNRKYKVPKAVMAQRLEIGWLNVARVRALCLVLFGYDPEMENWDQSPFHHNESGSQNVTTLAVAGSVVPLIEGHAATRERWTANLTTFSNKERLLAEGPPYSEFMFKASGERIELNMREHIRSRGYGPWVSVATSEKGSYRKADVLAFLDRHLPKADEPQSRPWRIIMADDFSAHLDPAVFRLCWSRRYVLICHGGGVTPVVQTPDTDLNQHVKREYINAETGEFLRQMRDGIVVPQLRREQCVDIMTEVLSNIKLHLQAADGYLKTGMTVALDGTQDMLIVREAEAFWNELGMRAKINSAVAEVRAEVAANRLGWNMADVQRIILPYPKHRHVDAILERLGDDTWIPEGECAYERECEEESSDTGDEGGAEVTEEDEEAADLAIVAALGGDSVRSCGEGDVEDVRSGGEAPTIASTIDAERLAASQNLISTYQHAIESLKAVGAQAAVANLDNEIRKEKRKMRAISRDDPEVMIALARQRDAQDARAREQRWRVEEENKRTLTASKMNKQIKDANELLRKRKQDIMNAESTLETKHAIKTYSLEDLGHGRSRGGGGLALKRRFEVLDRLARLGQGLSPPQKNDFSWWKNAWDSQMLEKHGDEWPKVFAGWMQKILNDHETGLENAFSLFVHGETRRCFEGAPALRVP